MAEKITIGNTLGFWYIDKDGHIMPEKNGSPKGAVITVWTHKNGEGELDTIEVIFTRDVKVSGYSKSAGTGLQSAATQELLKTVMIKKGTLEEENMEYLPDEDKFIVDCEFAADDKDVDPNAAGKIIDGFREARKQHNNACPPDDPNDDSDDNKSKKPEPDSEPKPVKKRPARKPKESANGTELAYASRDQTDRDTHDTLVAMFGEDSDEAKYYNGLVWDDVAKVYKDA